MLYTGHTTNPTHTGRYLKKKLLVAVDVSTNDRLLCKRNVPIKTTVVEPTKRTTISELLTFIASFLAYVRIADYLVF
jgi:hypothetical protein